ncbi:MAG: sulfurtransferase-like selenium metabolism protein YedF [Oscillospiraceae bacterium]|nr:sulfurtransferase-like selenium metabolism protein YedF [Oscillospiraceae bacterium]
MITVNAMGDACPLPVVKTLNAIKGLRGPECVETLVDNPTAVENLRRLAQSRGCSFSSEKRGEAEYRVLLGVSAEAELPAEEAPACYIPPAKKRVVVAVTADHMGEGDPKLGRTLLKGFLFALGQLEELPAVILFYNGGAALSCEGSESLEDLKALEGRGVEILTCGTCLNFYGLSEKLRVGGVTNMYSIVETLAGADLVLRP